MFKFANPQALFLYILLLIIVVIFFMATGVAVDQMVMSGFLFVAHEMYVTNNKEVDIQKLEKIVRKIDFDDDKLTYTNFNDKYDVNRYVKAWIKLAKVKTK